MINIVVKGMIEPRAKALNMDLNRFGSHIYMWQWNLSKIDSRNADLLLLLLLKCQNPRNNSIYIYFYLLL